MIDRYRQRDARKSEKEASRQTKEKEEKHEGVLSFVTVAFDERITFLSAFILYRIM